MHSFTDEQLLNLINNTIIKKTEFKPIDFTGGSVQITSTNNHQLMKYKVSLFFGYQNRNAISRTIDIKEDYLTIWLSALLLKTKSMQIKNNGMDLSELNEMMNISPRSNIVEVVSNIVEVVSKGSTNIVPTSYDIDSEIIASDLYTRILTVNQEFKGDYKKWIPDIEKMLRIDKRDMLDIQNCLHWIYTNGKFWIPNIMSGKKLRDKFDTLFIQMNNKPQQVQQKTKQQQNNDFIDEYFFNMNKKDDDIIEVENE